MCLQIGLYCWKLTLSISIIMQKKFVFETAKRCVEDGLSLRGKELQHARHFAGNDFAALKDAFPIFKEGMLSSSSFSVPYRPY